jgi:hypothetical protein
MKFSGLDLRLKFKREMYSYSDATMHPYRQERAGRRSAAYGSEQRRETSQETRHQTRLPFSLTLMDGQADILEEPHTIQLMGHTHDINANGLSLVGPLIRFGYRYLMGRSHTLRIELQLPSGPIEMEATPNRYLQLEAGATDTGFIMTGGAEMDSNQTEIPCLIGVLITNISDVDRALYDEYLHMLGQVEAGQMNFIVGIEDNLWDEATLAHNAI